eukprot:3239421-Pleurochrysis_carterae.AAC.1
MVLVELRVVGGQYLRLQPFKILIGSSLPFAQCALTRGTSFRLRKSSVRMFTTTKVFMILGYRNACTTDRVMNACTEFYGSARYNGASQLVSRSRRASVDAMLWACQEKSRKVGSYAVKADRKIDGKCPRACIRARKLHTRVWQLSLSPAYTVEPFWDFGAGERGGGGLALFAAVSPLELWLRAAGTPV